MKAFIPENLDLEQFLHEHLPAFNYQIDHFRHIIGLITSIAARNGDLVNEYGYVPLNSILLKKSVNNYRLYIDYLLDNGIFETDNLYIKGVKSKGYRFTLKYSVPVISVELTQFTLVKKLNKQNPNKITPKKTKYPYLACWLNDDLAIDVDKAHAFVTELYKYDLKDGFQKAILKQNASLYNIYNLKEHLFYFKTDQSGGRVYTPITTMKGLLRNFITYNGRKLVSVDIANSQPFFSTLLCNSEFYRKTSNHIVYNNNIIGIGEGIINAGNGILSIENIKKGIVNKSVCDRVVLYIMWVKNELSLSGKGFQRYIDDVVNGRLYEVMREECREHTDIDLDDRKELKKMMFMVLFTDNKFFQQKGDQYYYNREKRKVMKQPDAIGKRIFKELYPETYEVFSIIKTKGKSVLPCLLQAIEAHVMLDVIAKRISRERPDIPLFTIHDSITCPVEDLEYVIRVMEEEILRLVGYAPTLKTEYWTPENAYIELNKLIQKANHDAKAA